MSPTQYAFLGGEYIPIEEAKISVMTHALHYGTTCFEGIRGNWNSKSDRMFVFRMREHYERLERSASILMVDISYNLDELCDLTIELLRKCSYSEDVYIRPLAYKSSRHIANLKLHDLQNELCIIVMPFGDYIDGTGPIDCMTSSWRRPEDSMIPTGVKLAGLYTTSILAKTEAIKAGFQEAILLNHDGSVSEGSGENIFMVRDGVLYTPAETDNCLMGITRGSVIVLAKEEMGLKIVERRINRSELYLADEVFLTGTAAHITPVGSLDNRRINDGKPGSITQALQKLYFSVIRGGNEKYLHWCTIV